MSSSDISDIDVPNRDNVSSKSRLVAFLLCTFVSGFGIHRFYVGKVKSGIVMILIGWLTFGIWHLIDWIVILCGAFKDSEGNVVREWLAE